MRRLGLLFAALAMAATPALSYDFGLILDNSTTLNFADSDTEWDQSNRAALWFLEDTAENWSLSFQGSYIYTNDRPWLFDIDELRFAVDFPDLVTQNSVLQLAAGRYRFSEFSGWVLDHVADGLTVGFSGLAVDIKLSAAYTGLQLKPKSRIVMSQVDAIEDADDDIIWTSPRLIEILDVTFPELFAVQDLTFSVVLQQDLRESVGRDEDVIDEGTTAPVAGGGIVNTQYWGVGLSGPIVPSFYYDLFLYVGTGESLSEIAGEYTYEPLRSYLGGGGVRYYNPSLLSTRVSLDMIYASGDSDTGVLPEGNTAGNAETFVPVSKKSPALVFTPRAQNLFLAQLSYSIRPMEILQTQLKGTLFYRPTEGGISEAGIDTTSDDGYLGSELDLIINVRPFSDLGFTLSSGLFWPSTGKAFADDYADLEGLIRFEASFGL
jgi:hypothetical protein